MRQALQAQRREFFCLVTRRGKVSPRLRELVDLAKAKKVRIKELDPQALTKLSGSEQHQGVLLECGPLPSLDLYDLIEPGPETSLILALDQIEDPQNLGALVRSAAFLGAKGIVHLAHKAAPLSPAASKASAGALESFPLALVGNLAHDLARLREEGYFIYGADAGKGSQPYCNQVRQDKLVLVMGNEGRGLRELTAKRCDALVHIPGQPGTESLNVSNAAAILLAHFGMVAGGGGSQKGPSHKA